MNDAAAMFSAARSKLSGLGGGGGVGGGGSPPGAEADPGANAVVVRPPSFWEKTFNFASESPFMRAFGGVFSTAGDAAGGIGDRILGETEHVKSPPPL